MLNQIKKWLDNPKKTYQEGLAIYHKMKIDKKFDKYFTEVIEPSRDDMHFKLLVKNISHAHEKLKRNPELQKQHVQAPVEKAAINNEPIVLKSMKKKIERPVIDENPHINRAELPEDLKKLYDNTKAMYKDMSASHVALKTAKTDEQRKSAAETVTMLEDKIRANWDTIDKWWNTRNDKKPDPATKVELTPAEVSKKIDAAKNYLRRYGESTNPDTVNKCIEAMAFLKSVNITWSPTKKADKGNKKK